MKCLKTCACSALLCLVFSVASAQKDQIRLNEPDYNKPKLFADLPERLPLEFSSMETLLKLPIGATVNTRATERLPFNGTVVSKAEDKDVQSVVVRLANRYGATLTFSKTRLSDGSFRYTGRIISLKHGDAYDVVPEGNGLMLKKKGLYDMFSE